MKTQIQNPLDMGRAALPRRQTTGRSSLPALIAAALLLSTINHQLSTAFAQGNLTPPGAPAPTMKSLAQIEPRTPITSLPYTISVPGSYYFVTNLTGTASGGITISASGVTVDLMGFELVGGTGSGILVSGSRTNLAVRNGTVRGWSDDGIGAGGAVNSQFDQLRARDNGVFGLNVGIGSSVNDCQAVANNSGIVVASGASVSRCVAAGNSNPGIDASSGSGCLISGCTVYDNFGGILAGEGSTVIGCIARQNFSDGITVGDGSTVKDCAARLNTGNGITALTGCIVKDCTATTNSVFGIIVGTGSTVNGCVARANKFHGISAADGSSVKDCTASGNTGNGVTIAADCFVNGCTMVGNTQNGIEATGGNDRIEANHMQANIGRDLLTVPSHDVIIQNTFNSHTISGPGFLGDIETTDVGMNTNKNPHANFSP